MVKVYYDINENGHVGNLVAGDNVVDEDNYPYHADISSLDLLNRPIITHYQMLEWNEKFKGE